MPHVAVLPEQEAAHDEVVGQIEGIGDGHPYLVALVEGVDDALQQAERLQGVLLVGRQLADDAAPHPTLLVGGHYQHDHVDIGAQSRQDDVDALIDALQRSTEKEIDRHFARKSLPPVVTERLIRWKSDCGPKMSRSSVNSWRGVIYCSPDAKPENLQYHFLY